MPETIQSFERIGISVLAENQPGVLHELTGAIAARRGNILSVESLDTLLPTESRLYFEIEVPGAEALLALDIGASTARQQLDARRLQKFRRNFHHHVVID